MWWVVVIVSGVGGLKRQFSVLPWAKAEAEQLFLPIRKLMQLLLNIRIAPASLSNSIQVLGTRHPRRMWVTWASTVADLHKEVNIERQNCESMHNTLYFYSTTINKLS